jgi:hypothetical protein
VYGAETPVKCIVIVSKTIFAISLSFLYHRTIMNESINVLGGELEPCSTSPMTGFYRTGCCDTGADDVGSHTVCAQVTAEFLLFSQECGNDLSTPAPAYQFPGLQPGDRWCVCAARWKQALDAGYAPPVILRATHQRALQVVSLEDLLLHALDAPDGISNVRASQEGA